MSFAVGDVVTLKSGGVPMTVATIHNDLGMVDCVWLHDGEYRTSRFPVSVLKLAEAPKNWSHTDATPEAIAENTRAAVRKIKGV